MTRTLLTQQKIETLQDALEQEMKIKAMVGYPQEYKGGETSQDPSIMGLQHKIVSLIEKLKEMQPLRLARLNVRCTHCLLEGHVVTKCPQLWGKNVGTSVARAQGAPPMGGVV